MPDGRLKIDMTPPAPLPQASGGNAHDHVLAQTHPPIGSAGFGSSPRASYDDDQVRTRLDSGVPFAFARGGVCTSSIL